MEDEPKLRVMILGVGAREHALAWKLAKSQKVEKVVVVPGNPGIKNGKICSTLNGVPISAANGFKELLGAAKNMQINLVIPGSQKDIFTGIGQHFSNGKNFFDIFTSIS
jgi:phosphoribosylamine-glycine ligase